MSKVYEKRISIKPCVREILWAYKRDNDLKNAVDKIGELLDEVWDLAVRETVGKGEDK
jgi:hypothetical protein